MKLVKKLCVLMTAVCTAVMFPFPCAAEETYSYTVLGDGTISLTCEDASVIHAEIPAELDGYTVTELAEGCFSDCTNLETVIIPDTVTAIQSYAFQNCVLLEELTIPASVTLVEDFVFEGCISLKEIHVDAENTGYFDTDGILFKRGTMTTLIRYPAAKAGTEYTSPAGCGTLSPWSFTDCRYLETVKLPDVQAIGADAFMGASSLRSAELSDGVTELIGAAFANCRELQSVRLPEDLKSIGNRCFYGCISLNDLNIPDTLESVGDMAFFGCVELTEIRLPVSLDTIGEYGIGYSVDNEGNPVLISGIRLDVPFGSKAYQYARENGIAYHSELPKGMLFLILIGLILAVLLAVGIHAEINRKKQERLAEAERIEQQRRKERIERNKQNKRKAGKPKNK